MANVFYVNKNYLRSTYFNVVLSGGAWDAAQSLDKLKNANLNDVAISADDAPASTIIHADLGAPRDIRCFSIPDNISTFNPSLAARQRIAGSNTPLWRGLEVNGNQSAGAGTLSVTNTTAQPVTVPQGVAFSIKTTLGTGQVVYNTYTPSAQVIIAASSTGTITLDGTLAINHNDTDVLQCNVGDFTNPVKLFDWEDVFQPVYEFGSLPWWNNSALTGKITEEQRINLPYPVVKVFPVVIAQYWRYELDDEGNRPWNDPLINIPHLVIGNGYQPTINPTYEGSRIEFLTETTVDVTLGGRRIVGQQPIARKFVGNLPDIPETEAFAEPFDMLWQDGITQEVMFIYNPDDTILMHRRAFLARMERINPLAFPYCGANDFILEHIEVL